jgi:hypothetical protein
MTMRAGAAGGEGCTSVGPNQAQRPTRPKQESTKKPIMWSLETSLAKYVAPHDSKQGAF